MAFFPFPLSLYFPPAPGIATLTTLCELSAFFLLKGILPRSSIFSAPPYLSQSRVSLLLARVALSLFCQERCFSSSTTGLTFHHEGQVHTVISFLVLYDECSIMFLMLRRNLFEYVLATWLLYLHLFRSLALKKSINFCYSSGYSTLHG